VPRSSDFTVKSMPLPRSHPGGLRDPSTLASEIKQETYKCKNRSLGLPPNPTSSDRNRASAKAGAKATKHGYGSQNRDRVKLARGCSTASEREVSHVKAGVASAIDQDGRQLFQRTRNEESMPGRIPALVSRSFYALGIHGSRPRKICLWACKLDRIPPGSAVPLPDNGTYSKIRIASPFTLALLTISYAPNIRPYLGNFGAR
jgi:hypothetical protein